MSGIKRVSCVVGTAGHIDHGKTTLVRALTDIDTDKLEEEKKRGISIDLGFAYLDFESDGQYLRAAIVDVPGHERFIKNMLAGATGMDVVVFVVAADDGVMPQTVEHFDIVRLLGVKNAVFVITKTDLAGAERIAEVRRDIAALVKGTLLAGSPVVSVSAVKGDGLDGLKRLIKDFVIKGRRAGQEGFFRLPIDRSFAIKGFGTVVTGTVASGVVVKGEELSVFPTGASVKVRGIQSLFMEADSISAGQRAALNLSGISHQDLERGFMLASPELSAFNDYARTPKPFYADCLFEFLPSAGNIKNRSLLKIHHMTGEALGKVQFLGKQDAEAGAKCVGRLILKKPMLMLKGDRFILRDPSRNITVGGGIVQIPYMARELLRKLDTVVFTEKECAGTDEALSCLLHATGLGFERKSVTVAVNMKEAGLNVALNGTTFEAIGPFIVKSERLAKIKQIIISLVTEFHRKNPMEAGVREEEILTEVRGAITPGVRKENITILFREVLELLVKERIFRWDGGAVALQSHQARSSGSPVEKAVLALFDKPFAPPLLDELKKLPFQKADVDKVIMYLQRSGVLVKLKEGVLISGEAVREAKAKLIEHIKTKGPIKAADFRDVLGCGRKLAIEILEYFDKERVTLRSGDARTLR